MTPAGIASAVSIVVVSALVAFATAYVAVRWMVAYLRERPLAHFGVYRLFAAGIAAVLVLAGVIG